MSSTSTDYRKPGRPAAASRHRKPSSGVSPWRRKPAPAPPPGVPWWRRKAVRLAAAAAVALLVAAWPAASHWMARAPSLAWMEEADALGMQAAGSLVAQFSQQTQIVSVGVAEVGYRDPLRGVSGLVAERIDMGVDFSGSGPVYAIGDGVVTNATGANFGWPGGGWITYQLTDGPDAGLVVYVAEDITPAVQVGQIVTPATVLGTIYQGGDGIETGWAQPDGVSSESELPEAGGIGGLGPFPTRIGVDFDELLQSLGVPAAPDFSQTAYGLLPPNYPANGG